MTALHHKFAGLLSAALLLLTGSNGVLAQPQIKILDVEKKLDEQHLLISAKTRFMLKPAIVQAVHHEVPLFFKTQIELLEKHNWLGIPYHRTRTQISFTTRLHAFGVNRLYTLHNNRNDKTLTFKTLAAAINTLTTINEVKVAKRSQLHPKQRYTLRMRLSLNRWQLPAPLLIDTFLTSKWEADSGWFETKLDTPVSWQ